MDYLFSLFPGLPIPLLDAAFYCIAGAGAVLLVYGVFLEAERRQDLVFVIAGMMLFIYATWIQEKLFAVAMAGFTVASAIEFIEIVVGIHRHNPEAIEKYKNPKAKIHI